MSISSTISQVTSEPIAGDGTLKACFMVLAVVLLLDFAWFKHLKEGDFL